MSKSFLKASASYWICQVLGWLAMVCVEMVNYTFFIVGKFSWGVLNVFLICAVAGIVFTHLYRLLVKRRKLFNASRGYIWLHAFLASLVISIMITTSTQLTYFLISGQWDPALFTLIGIGGYLMNWMRYVGVWIIIYFMYTLSKQNAQILNEKLQVENLAKTTELELLKMQLNPHFLFNALNSIKALVIINPEKSRDAIVQLSELLRFTLQYGKEKTIQLQYEIEEVKKYLSLEKLRFEDRLTINYTIEPNLYTAPIPPALLLTLVENAIKHGVAKNVGITEISVSAQKETETHMTIGVSNTGNYSPQGQGGIGLNHITKRLEEIYGASASFLIKQEKSLVSATLQIPLAHAH